MMTVIISTFQRPRRPRTSRGPADGSGREGDKVQKTEWVVMEIQTEGGPKR